MLQTLGMIQVRPCPAGQCSHQRRFGGKSVLEWVVRRATDCQLLDGVVIVARDVAEEADIAALAPRDVPVFVSDAADGLSRFVAATEHYRARAVVRICADNPFLDPTLIDRLVATAAEHPSRDYITYCSRNGAPAIESPMGVYAEWFTTKALRRADQLAQRPAERDDVTAFIRQHPEEFAMRLAPLPAAIDREDIRLMLRGEEDWEIAQQLYESIEPEQLDWQGIAHFLEHQPQLRERMAALNRAVQ